MGKVRRRIGVLYEDFKPSLSVWRLALMARKLGLATLHILYSRQPAFQAAAALFCLFFFNSLHVELYVRDREGRKVASNRTPLISPGSAGIRLSRLGAVRSRGGA